MIVFDLKWAVFCLLLLLSGLAYWAFTAVRHRRRMRLSSLTAALNASDIWWSNLQTAPFGLLLLDETPTITYANQYAQQHLSPAWQEELFQDVLTLAQSDKATNQYRILNLPNEQAISWWLCPFGTQTVVLLNDLSQQRQSERATRLFLNSLSHELRTPITAVLAHIEVMRTADIPQSVTQNSLSQIHRETNRISRLVQNLLVLSRLEIAEELPTRPIDLLILVEEAIADVILIAEAQDIHISLQADTDLPRVLADPDRIKQVLFNLLDNSVKYGRAGDRVNVQLQKDARGVQVTCQDSGPGIEAQHLPQVAEKLYRARNDVPGSGLGLAIVSEILQRHDSDLHIESEANGEQSGTTITFVLPTA